ARSSPVVCTTTTRPTACPSWLAWWTNRSAKPRRNLPVPNCRIVSGRGCMAVPGWCEVKRPQDRLKRRPVLSTRRPGGRTAVASAMGLTHHEGMENELRRRLARIDRRELSGAGPDAPPAVRGRYLRQLLLDKGIDPSRLYHVEYYANHHCWLVTQ